MTDRLEQRIARDAQRCVHYKPMRLLEEPGSSDTCARGVTYREAFDDTKPGIALRLPCRASIRPEMARMPCPVNGYEPIGMDEARRQYEERQVRFGAAMDRISVALPAIEAARAKGERAGAMPCPACDDGTLHWAVADNGHRRARCTTDGCVGFIE